VSSIKATAKDTAALPAALLPIAKDQMRIDGTFEDAFITSVIARAIAWFERVTNVTVNPTTFEWTPDWNDFTDQGLSRFSESPVEDMTAKIAGTDATSSYSVTTMSTHGVGIYALDGAWASGLVVTFDSGYASMAELPAGILDAILRYSAHLYEHREILVPTVQAASPGWMSDVVSTYWMPRA
jgi:uncharacterized phiE125 gp8 family phage protein